MVGSIEVLLVHRVPEAKPLTHNRRLWLMRKVSCNWGMHSILRHIGHAAWSSPNFR